MGGPLIGVRPKWFWSNGAQGAVYGTYNLVIPVTGILHAFAWGAGGSASCRKGGGGTTVQGGGGAGAAYKQIGVRAGTALQAVVGQAPTATLTDGPGTDGQRTTIRVGPFFFGGGAGLAGGWNGAVPITAPAINGGRGFGGDINRRGGNGLVTNVSGARAESGEFGSLGGITPTNTGDFAGGGGGAAGFSDFFLPGDFPSQGEGGGGGNGANGVNGGGGGGGNIYSSGGGGGGGHGRVILFVLG